MKIVVYLINLDSSVERLKSATEHLMSLGITFERVSAFDGRKIDVNAWDGYDQDKAMQFMGRDLVGGELGCYYSHLNCAKQFISSDAQVAVVLEDDVLMTFNIVKIIEDAVDWLEQNGSPDWEMMNVGNKKLKLSSNLCLFAQDEHKHHLHAAHYFPITTSAIVWSRVGAKAFITEHDKIFAPVDIFFRFWQTRRNKGFSFYPPLASITDAESIIDAGVHRKKTSRSYRYYWVKQSRLWIDKCLAFKNKLARF